MGVDVLVCGATDDEHAAVQRLFDEHDRVFSRFRAASELNRVNRDSSEVVVLSPLFADALRTALGAAAATDGLVDPTLGGAIVAAGYDRDFSVLADDERPVGPSVPGRWRRLRLSARLLSRPPGIALDLNGVVKALAVDAALGLISGDALVVAGGDVATRGGAVVGLPGGGSLRLLARRGRDERDDEAPMAPRGRGSAPPDRPAHGPPGRVPLGRGHGRRRLVRRRRRGGQGRVSALQGRAGLAR